MKEPDSENNPSTSADQISTERREFLKSAGVATAATAMGASSARASRSGC